MRIPKTDTLQMLFLIALSKLFDPTSRRRKNKVRYVLVGKWKARCTNRWLAMNARWRAVISIEEKQAASLTSSVELGDVTSVDIDLMKQRH